MQEHVSAQAKKQLVKYNLKNGEEVVANITQVEVGEVFI